MGAIYTKEMDEFIKEKFNKLQPLEFMFEFNRKFTAGRTENALSQRARLLGITRTEKVIEESKPLDINEIRKRAIGKTINGYKLKHFYPQYALYEKTYPTGEVIKTTYSYFDLNRFL